MGVKLENNKMEAKRSVLQVMSYSDVMFCLQSYQRLIIDRSLVY